MADHGLSTVLRSADRWWIAVPLLALLLLIPTLLHGRPFVFWDTAQYYGYGAKLVEFAVGKFAASRDRPAKTDIAAEVGPTMKAGSEGTGITFYGARSPFYSVWLYSLARTVGVWAALFAQSALAAWVIWRAATHALGKRGLEWAAAAVALATLGAGAWFAAGFVMPDCFAAIALCCVALLLAYADQMSRAEQLGVAVLLAMSAMFHTTHLVTAAAVCVAAAVAAFLLRPETGSLPRRGLAVAAAGLALAVALQAAFDAAARAALGASLQRPPFLMARIVADGPGRLYLDKHCSQGGSGFALCAYRERTFKTADEFLWVGLPEGVFQTLSLEQRRSLIDEELRFVAAVAMHYPLRVLWAVTANASEQFVRFWPAEAWIDPGASFKDPPFRESSLFEVVPFLHSCVERPGSCVPTLPKTLVSGVVNMTIVFAFVVLAIHVAAPYLAVSRDDEQDRMHRKAVVFALLIVAGLIFNAVLCGAISGPHERYQARVVWLVVVATTLLEAIRPLFISHLMPRKWR